MIEKCIKMWKHPGNMWFMKWNCFYPRLGFGIRQAQWQGDVSVEASVSGGCRHNDCGMEECCIQEEFLSFHRTKYQICFHRWSPSQLSFPVTTGQILKPPSVVRVFPAPRGNIKDGGKMTPRGEQGGGMGVRWRVKDERRGDATDTAWARAGFISRTKMKMMKRLRSS